MIRKYGLSAACLLLAAMLLLSLLPALGEGNGAGEYLGTLRVCNCNEWVSLRKKPKTSADRLIKVPLGALVTDCVRMDDKFIYCTYDGQSGYILAEYLEKAGAGEVNLPETGNVFPGNEVPMITEQDAVIEVEELPPVTVPEVPAEVSVLCSKEYLEMMSGGGECILLENVARGEKRFTLCAVRERKESGETVFAALYDVNLRPVWARMMTSPDDSQFESLEVFRGGDTEEPRVMLYNSEAGLQAVDLFTGEEKWTLSAQDVHLGAGISWAVEADGTMYIAGADGPHPVAVSSRGTLLWYSDPGNSEVYGPYRITLLPEGVFTEYESGSHEGGAGHYAVLYSYFGENLKVDLIR